MPRIVIVALYAALLVTPAYAAARNDRVYAAVEANRAGFLDLLGRVVNIDSGTGDVAGGAKVSALLADRLKACSVPVPSPSAPSASRAHPGFI